MSLVARRVANSPSMLALVNKGGKHMAKKRKRKATHHKSHTKRRHTASHKSHRAAAHKRANPRKGKRKVYASKRRTHHHKRHTARRHNPLGLGSGVLGEAVNYSIAGFAITIGNGYVQPLVSRFVPGQFAAPVSKALTGYGLGWIAGKFSITSRLKRPLQIMGLALAVTDLARPLLAGILGGGQKTVGPQGRHSGWRQGPNGWALVTGIPPTIVSPAQAASQAAGPQGWSAVRRGYAHA